MFRYCEEPLLDTAQSINFTSYLFVSFNTIDCWIVYSDYQRVEIKYTEGLITVERFSIECHKTKTKVITLTNHNTRKQRKHNEPIWTQKQIHVASAKRGKTRATKSRLVLILHLIEEYWDGASFFKRAVTDRGIKQNQSNPGILSTLNWKPL